MKKKMKKKPVAANRRNEEADCFIKRFTCPTCGRFLASFTWGHDWTENGVHEEDVRDCRGCGQTIDWSGVPVRRHLLRRD